MPTPNIDRNTYLTDSRFAEFREKGVSYESFSLNQSYYLNQLSKTSVMDLYSKGKAMYEKYTELYNQSNNLFIQLKNKQAKNLEKYNEILQSYAKQNNSEEVTSSQKSSAALKSGYTLDSIKETNDAENQTEIFLDLRRAGVSMQQKGLTQSVFDSL